MELPPSSSAGSGKSMEFTQEMAETFQFREEIQSLMENDLQHTFESPRENGNSFTALLGLPTNQAIELLHEPESDGSSRDQQIDQKQLGFSFSRSLTFPSFSCSTTFPSDAALREPVARFSIFGGESPQTSSDPSNASENSMKLKIEPTDSDSNPNSSPIFTVSAAPIQKQRSGKRNEGEKNKVKAPAKRSKTGEESKGGEKLPYVHVRARRGEATDSHSLAERARREKINARMKLLQELVPGCNKISGTALVLDEIINHVQSLQRQVEFLSMRLAAVNPRIDFGSLDTILTSDNTMICLESGDLPAGNVASMVAMDSSLWPQIQASQAFLTHDTTLLGYDSANSVAQHFNQLKIEL